LSLVSATSGGAGNISVTSNSLADSSNGNAPLSYKSTVTGVDASLNIDGVDLLSPSNTATNLIPGVTFQILSPTATDSNGDPVPVQVIIANDNAGVETAVNTMVTDYNSLINAINAQTGNDAAGNAQPLFGSPTLSLLQQQLLSSINTQNPNGYLDAIKNASDTLSGTISIQVGSGIAHQIDMSTLSDKTLSGLASAINAASIGATATVVTKNGLSTLTLLSGTAGSAGALNVVSNIVDTTNSNTTLNYTHSSDIPGLTGLGISMNNDGTISLDANTLDSALNSDFSGVVGFFQSANSWGMTTANVLNQAGTSSSTGILKLAQKANSTMESNLNADIAREETLISAQQKNLTTELNKANEILQELPSQLSSVDMLYSAITGYNQKS
jgi:flagellar hook-associated protein 2